VIGGVPLFGHRDLRSASPGRIFTNCRRMIESHIDIFSPNWVFAEQPFVGQNAFTAQRLYGLRAVLEMVCDERDVPLTWVSIKQVSEFFIGTGGLRKVEKKTATIRAAEARGLRVTTDDEADAAALFFFGEARLAPQLQRAAGSLFARAS
jgi:Holliday junction resolvasome RuvABC endonuclease subunit